MITREDIRELAQFQSENGEGCALSFYFQPQTPQNKSHKEEAILAKDLVRNAMHEAEKEGKNGGTRADLQRILEIAGNLRGNQAKGKATGTTPEETLGRELLTQVVLKAHGNVAHAEVTLTTEQVKMFNQSIGIAF